MWFADGILPNGEVADTSRLSAPSPRSAQESGPAACPDPTAVRDATLPSAARTVRPGVLLTAPVNIHFILLSGTIIIIFKDS